MMDLLQCKHIYNNTVIYIFMNIYEQYITNMYAYNQGYNARKVISEVYEFFVLQCTVSGR